MTTVCLALLQTVWCGILFDMWTTRSLRSAAHLCRSVAVALISGLRPAMTFEQVEARVAARPVGDQTMIVGGTLALLFLLALIAAQIGWVAMLVYWLAVIVVAR